MANNANPKNVTDKNRQPENFDMDKFYLYFRLGRDRQVAGGGRQRHAEDRA